MKYSPEQLDQAAHAIQPYLTELLDAPRSQRLEIQLEQALSETSLTRRDNILLDELLSEYPETNEWIRLLLEEQRPAETILEAMRVYYPIRGLNHPVKSPRYVCPVKFCTQDWYRQSLDDEIPRCPVHDVPLIIDS